MVKQKNSNFILISFWIGLLTSSIHIQAMENDNQECNNVAGSKEAAAMLFEKALIESDSHAINIIVNYAKTREIDPCQLLNAECHLNAAYKFPPLQNIHQIFLKNFFRIITDTSLTTKEKFSCIQTLANLPLPKEVTYYYEPMYDTFISLCNFNNKTINVACAQALNLAFLCKDIKFLELIFNNLKEKQVKLETIVNKDTLKNLLLHSPFFSISDQEENIIKILKCCSHHLSTTEFENLCNGSFDKENHMGITKLLLYANPIIHAGSGSSNAILSTIPYCIKLKELEAYKQI